TTLGHDSVVEAVPRSSLSVVVTDAAHDDPTLAALAAGGTDVRTACEEEVVSFPAPDVPVRQAS
ncbi:hypothetical protein ACFT5B_16825, partial [Luteimicrobium sp. NPDC057192]|uniref:hypothetical protein n=1 Tax=Luteimicrobium sp. NPDC057192 TaxID=3346042 RepID=UPI00363CCDA0